MTISTFHDLSGCQLELVPDAGIGLTGANLTTWSDQSGLSRHASLANLIADGYATATAPVYSASDAAFSGKPTITYGGGGGGGVLTTGLAIAQFTNVPPPFTFVLAGQLETPPLIGTVTQFFVFDRLAGTDNNNRVTWTNCSNTGSISGGNYCDSLAALFNGTQPPATNVRRIIGANVRDPFIQVVIVPSTTSCVVIHNGQVRLARTIPIAGNGPIFAGLRLGCTSFNVSSVTRWIGKLNLFVLYNRELTFAEARDATTLASTKTGIAVINRRLAA